MMNLIMRKPPLHSGASNPAQAVAEKQTFEGRLVAYPSLSSKDLRHPGRKHLAARGWSFVQVHVLTFDGVDLHRFADEGHWIDVDVNPRPAGQVVEDGRIRHDPAAQQIHAHLVDAYPKPFGRFRR